MKRDLRSYGAIRKVNIHYFFSVMSYLFEIFEGKYLYIYLYLTLSCPPNDLDISYIFNKVKL